MIVTPADVEDSEVVVLAGVEASSSSDIVEIYQTSYVKTELGHSFFSCLHMWEWHHMITVANNKTDNLLRWGIRFALPERRGNMKP